jgi:hypothetical protein
LGHHVSQQGIRRNVKGHTETHVGTSLVHLTRELILVRVNLNKLRMEKMNRRNVSELS